MTEHLSIALQIQEAEAWVRSTATEAARPGKGQEIARLRHSAAQSILTTLEWCRDNSEDLRKFRASKGETE